MAESVSEGAQGPRSPPPSLVSSIVSRGGLRGGTARESFEAEGQRLLGIWSKEVPPVLVLRGTELLLSNVLICLWM